MRQEQLTGWEDPTAKQQQQTGLPNTEQPKSVPDVGMGQELLRKTQPQFF